MYSIVEKKEHSELHIKYKKDIKVTIVDKKIVPELKKYSWSIWRKKNKRGGKVYYYVACRLSKKEKSKTFYIHHLVAGKVKGSNVIDHINRNTLDNRACNLRVATRAENTINSPKFDK